MGRMFSDNLIASGRKPASTRRWILKWKPDQPGHVEKVNARLVAKGFNQFQGVDFFETVAPHS